MHPRKNKTNTTIEVLERDIKQGDEDLQYQITELYQYTDAATSNIHTRIDETNSYGMKQNISVDEVNGIVKALEYHHTLLNDIAEDNEPLLNYVDAKVQNIKEELAVLCISTENKFNKVHESIAECSYTVDYNENVLNNLVECVRDIEQQLTQSE